MSNTNNALKAEGFVSAGNAGGDITFIKPKDMKAGQTIKGVYVKTLQNPFGGTDFRIQTADGLVGIGGSGHLTYKMAGVPVGSTVLITYEGTEKLSKGKFAGKAVHQFDVLYKPSAANAVDGDDTSDVEEDLNFDE